MSQSRNPKPDGLMQDWIDTIMITASDKLSEWETEFVSSVERQLQERGKLSEKQEDTLERIYTTRTTNKERRRTY